MRRGYTKHIRNGHLANIMFVSHARVCDRASRLQCANTQRLEAVEFCMMDCMTIWYVCTCSSGPFNALSRKYVQWYGCRHCVRMRASQRLFRHQNNKQLGLKTSEPVSMSSDKDAWPKALRTPQETIKFALFYGHQSPSSMDDHTHVNALHLSVC